MAIASKSQRPRLRLLELESRITPTAPVSPVIINPLQNAETSSFSMRLEINGLSFFDADGDTFQATNWQLREMAENGGAVVWEAPNKTDPTNKVHVSFNDGTFVGTLAGQSSLIASHPYELVVTVTDSANEVSLPSITTFTTLPQQTPVPGEGEWAVKAGYRVEVVGQEAAFRLPTKIAFVPNPGSNPNDPLFYVTELYGSIKVVTRDGQIRTYASGLLDYNPDGPIAGDGEQGLTGIVVDPETGDLFITLLWDNGSPPEFGGHYPKIERLKSSDGGLTMASRELILNMAPETQGQAHQISEVTLGPDGKLYVNMGDAFDASNGLDLTKFRGKILRLNKDGTAPTDNPFYNAGDGITATDYIYSYGHRNPFAAVWRAANNTLYVGETGNTIDHLEFVTAGRNMGYDGTDASMIPNTLYNWDPSAVPAGLTIIQSQTFGGSLFPSTSFDHLFVGLTGPTYAGGPQANGKRIEEFSNLDSLDANGKLTTPPTTLVSYNGDGRYSIVGVAAGPDGLYFTTLFPDNIEAGPTGVGGSIFRVRYVGFEPTNLQATAVTDTAVLTWTGNSLASSYNVYGRAVDGTITRLATGITENGYTVTGLVPGLTYTFFVRGVNAGGESDDSTEATINPGSGGNPTTNGLTAEYFDFADFLPDIPDLSGKTPDVTRIEGAPNYLTDFTAPNQSWTGLDSRFADTYVARYTGFLQIDTAGSYTFYTSSDDGSRLYIDGQLVVENGGLHGIQERSGTVTLTPGLHTIRLEYLEAFGEQQLQLTWSGPGFVQQAIPTTSLFTTAPTQNQPPTIATPAAASGNPVAGSPLSLTVLGADDRGEANLTYQWAAVVKPVGASDPVFAVNGSNASKNTTVTGLVAGSYTFRVTVLDAQGQSITSTVSMIVNPPISATNGLVAEYFDFADSLSDIPDLSDKTPDVTRIEGSPNYLTDFTAPNQSWTGLDFRFADTYVARYTGFLQIDTAGSYTFYTSSDDGSRLYIDGQLVVENGGLHGIQERSGSVTLNPGLHTIRLEYLEAFGEQQLQLTWSGPGFVQQAIPTTSLFTTAPTQNQPPTIATPATVSGNPIAGSPLNLSVLGADDGGEANLTYQWGAVVKPVGATDPVFAANGTNASKNTTATGLVAGSYTFRVTVLDAQGQSVTSTVSVIVNPPIAASNGLLAEYFDFSEFLPDIPDLAGKTPDVTQVEGSPNYLTDWANPNAAWTGLDSRFADTYVARYTGFLQIDTAGSYTFYTSSDDGSRLYIDGQLVVENGGLHGIQERSGSVTLNPGLHTIRLEYLEAFGEQQLQLTWSGPGFVQQAIPTTSLFTTAPTQNQSPTIATPAAASGNPVAGSPLSLTVLGTDDNGEANLTYQWTAVVKPVGASDPVFALNGSNASKNTNVTGLVAGSYTFRVTVLDAQGQSVTSTISISVNPPVPQTNGLIAQYFDLGDNPTDTPNFTGLTPDVTRVEGTPNYVRDPLNPNEPWMNLDSRFADTFAARYSGFIQIDTPGSYTFYTTSDDGSRLFIDDQLVVENGGLHGTQERSATVNLNAGKHSIRLEYLEAYGDQVLSLEWEGPGFGRGLIPVSILTTS